MKRVKMPVAAVDEEDEKSVREGLSRDKNPMKKKAERDYAKNVTEKNKRKVLMKQKPLGMQGFGAIIGLEESILTNSEVYSTTVVCMACEKNSLTAELYRMEASTFKTRI